MKKLILSALLSLTAVTAFAQAPDQAPVEREGLSRPPQHRMAREELRDASPEQLAKFKQLLLQRMDKQSERLVSVKRCIQAATTHDALRACHEKMREGRKHPRGQRHESRNPDQGGRHLPPPDMQGDEPPLPR